MCCLKLKRSLKESYSSVLLCLGSSINSKLWSFCLPGLPSILDASWCWLRKVLLLDTSHLQHKRR